MVLSVLNEVYKEFVPCNVVLRKDFGRSVDENFCLCAFVFLSLNEGKHSKHIEFINQPAPEFTCSRKSSLGTHL